MKPKIDDILENVKKTQIGSFHDELDNKLKEINLDMLTSKSQTGRILYKNNVTDTPQYKIILILMNKMRNNK